MRLLPIALLAVIACRNKDNIGETGLGNDSGPAGEIDSDGDGYVAADDCDDTNPDVHPGAEEVPYDGLDNDCDGATADDDLDGDGFGVEDDCDDADAGAFPGAEELCDGVDNDCDGEVDDGAADASTYYADSDGDGWGTAQYTQQACERPEGYAEAAGDCDDADAAYHPGAPEEDCTDPNDYNCDGSVGFADNDGDGYPACEECDDSRRDVNPSATEVCDELDNDCDGEIDADAVDAATWYQDLDSDAYGDPDFSIESCDQPTGYADNGDDCDDGEAAINPGATELCNGIDDDCDGDTDEDDAADAATWYADGDGDGYGAPAYSTAACTQPSGYVSNSGDCDDSEPLAWTGATESCDSVDNDCDSGVDEGVISTWYIDVDSDGYGSARYTLDACTQPSGYVGDGTDCDDGAAAVNPGATEVCNAIDDDCDNLIDDDDSSLDTSTADVWYDDVDVDGYGDANSSTLACTRPSGMVADDTDCDDAEATTNPGAAELCDTVDNDCDGVADGGLLGQDPLCAAESCNEILLDGSSLGDGTYYLDPTATGNPELYNCDMTTDGGGWTRVMYWNREDDGETIADFEAELTLVHNDMGWFDESNSAYIEWADLTVTSDVLAYEHNVEVPNGGETLFDYHFEGRSMECSGVWFYMEDASANEYDLNCAEDLPPCSHDTSANTYSATDLSYVPSYTCGNSANGSWTWEEALQQSHGVEVTNFNIRSLMWDSYGDQARLYRMELLVR